MDHTEFGSTIVSACRNLRKKGACNDYARLTVCSEKYDAGIHQLCDNNRLTLTGVSEELDQCRDGALWFAHTHLLTLIVTNNTQKSTRLRFLQVFVNQ